MLFRVLSNRNMGRTSHYSASGDKFHEFVIAFNVIGRKKRFWVILKLMQWHGNRGRGPRADACHIVMCDCVTTNSLKEVKS